MDHVTVLKRAWNNVWHYRALWVFGIILALTTGSGGEETASSALDGGNHRDRSMAEFRLPDDFSVELGDGIRQEIEELNRLFSREIPPQVAGTVIAVVIGLLCVGVLLFVVGRIARYVAETAMIGMIDKHEETGKQQSVRQGFRMGWSRAAWRLFLIDLAVDLPVVLTFVLLFALAFVPLVLGTSRSTGLGTVGIVSTIGLFFAVVFLAIVVGAALSLLKRLFRRACVLDGLGVAESIRRGWAMVRQNLKDAGLMWLIMIGVNLAWMLAMVPIGALLFGVGAVMGGGPALLAGKWAESAFGVVASWIVGGAVGVPIFLAVVVAPLVFLGGLREVFQSNAWTLTYRELRALEQLEPGQLTETAA